MSRPTSPACESPLHWYDIRDPSDILTPDADDFIIGDRVWVNGSKPGYIQFIGETKFAPGDWAGVVLDEPVGKNDGSVSGVRYFQCEPRRGVFARLQRLSRHPTTVAALNSAAGSPATLIQESPGKSLTTRTVVRPCSPSGGGPLSGPPRAVITNTETVAVDHGLRVGDRVIVNASSGFKSGQLRYIGATEFAQGHWCGVELDEPTGKNDGSVASKRYFTCRPKYGLFAPVHKVAREGGHTTTTVHTTTRTTKVTSPPRMLTRTGSRDSVASAASSTASSRASLSRLAGPTAAGGPQRALRPSSSSSASAAAAAAVAGGGGAGGAAAAAAAAAAATGANRHRPAAAASAVERASTGLQQHPAAASVLAAAGADKRRTQQGQFTDASGEGATAVATNFGHNQNALQVALREKEEHIEQLLKERDLEQTEIARVSAHREEAEARLRAVQGELAKLRDATSAEQDSLRKRLRAAERERDESNRKLEDVQFALAELEINKADADQDRAQLQKKVAELEETLKTVSTSNAGDSNSQLNLKIVELEAKHRQQIEDFQRRLDDARGELKAARDQREGESRSSRETEKALALKADQLKTLEGELVKYKTDCEQLTTKVDRLEHELFEMAEKSQGIRVDEVEELREKFRENEKKLSDERQLSQKLQKEKTDFVTQCDIFESQIKDLHKNNDDLRKQLEQAHTENRDLTTKLHAEIDLQQHKLQDAESSLKMEKASLEKVLNERDKLELELNEGKSRFEETEKQLAGSRDYVSQLEGEKKRLQDELELLRREIAEKELSALEGERTADGILQEKILEVESLRHQLADRDDKISKLTRSTSELTHGNTSLTNELETLRGKLENEKKNFETALKKAEHECESLRFEMENTSAGFTTEMGNLKRLLDQTMHDADTARTQLATANDEIEQLRTRGSKMTCDLENSQRLRESAITEAELLRAELADVKAHLAEADRQKTRLERELDKESDRCKNLEQVRTHLESLLANEKEVSKRRVQDVEESLERARKQADTHATESHDALRRLRDEKDEAIRQVDQLRKTAREYQEQLDEARHSSDRLEQANEVLGRELEALRRLVESTTTADRELQRTLAQLDERRRREDDLRGELVDAINEADRLRRELAEQQQLCADAKIQLDQKAERLQKTEELLRRNEHDRKEQAVTFKSQMESLRNEFDRYRQTLVEQLESTKIASSEIAGQREIVSELQKQLSSKKTEIEGYEAEAISLRACISDLEHRLATQTSEMNALQKTVSRPRSRSPTKSPVSGFRTDEEKDQQIDFLNSIIVDMQRKNDEYRARIQVLEANPGDTKSSLVSPGSASTISRNGLAAFANSTRGPRLFCDICEVFDLHDTEDCPRQASENEEANGHSRFGGPRGPSARPYCTTCESFGHTAVDCEIEEY